MAQADDVTTTRQPRVGRTTIRGGAGPAMTSIICSDTVQPWGRGDYVFIMKDGSRVLSGKTYREKIRATLVWPSSRSSRPR